MRKPTLVAKMLTLSEDRGDSEIPKSLFMGKLTGMCYPKWVWRWYPDEVGCITQMRLDVLPTGCVIQNDGGNENESRDVGYDDNKNKEGIDLNYISAGS